MHATEYSANNAMHVTATQHAQECERWAILARPSISAAERERRAAIAKRHQKSLIQKIYQALISR